MTTVRLPALRCAGCATLVLDPTIVACPAAADGDGDDIDHVLCVEAPTGPWPEAPISEAANPFVHYRALFHTYRLALTHGMSDADYVALVGDLDEQVAEVDRPFRVTPLIAAPQLAAALKLADGVRLLLKNETVNVSGSHKARHLMGLMIHLRVLDSLGLSALRRPLAIASCGNAALGAAVVARAASWPLEVFVPAWADPDVVSRLERLDAVVRRCERAPGELGDPCVRRFKDAVISGAVPFGVQGPANGLSLEGGTTIGYELAHQLGALGVPADELYIQVGGGALAASVSAGLATAHRLGGIERLPRLVAVQSSGCAPLARAWRTASTRLDSTDRSHESIDEVMSGLARQRSAAMKPWTPEPTSVATGILDDETYDWRAVVQSILHTGGRAEVVEEEDLLWVHRLVRDYTAIAADPTGTSGLAGIAASARRGELATNATVVALITGADRSRQQGP